ncbi:solute carrier family 2, facilitated glucose transporter member 10 [Plakobranchus ocellatus]|uniref:Solute carrier family 2, facilitated glucose transporter member 10 n=1 Tax=Plakobranchus ocellatus TaxID=259542 RepID=A0AAV4AK52_9GAST|nr:solute carrier family 2, facilitated glucose transporter member 10 [Plakobranchus ocellatus]
MSSFKTKKRLMYITFSFIFLFGGIEYAVILPTLWLYLHNTYNPPEYMLGLVLSAYSLAAFLSAPMIGRLSDKFRCTKQIILICCTFEMVGSFLYFIGISEWLCVASRFISGLGAASEAIAVAEVSRYTTEQERTGIISNLIATQQIALLLGPALNLFLRLADFKLGPFPVTKYSAPAAFMVLMWVLLMLVVLLLYSEPKEIYAEQQANSGRALDCSEEAAGDDSSQIRHTVSNVSRQKHFAYIDSNDFLASDDGSEITYPPLSSEKPFGQHNYDDWESSDHLYHEIGGDETAIARPQRHSKSLEVGQDNTSRISPQKQPKDISRNYMYGSMSDESSNMVQSVNNQKASQGISSRHHGDDNFYSDAKCDGELEAFEDSQDGWTTSLPNGEADLSTSEEILASAERLINRNQWSVSEKAVKAYNVSSSRGKATPVGAKADIDLFFCDDHFGHQADDVVYSDGTGSEADERTALLGSNRQTKGRRHNGVVTNQAGENGSYIERSLTALDDPISREGKLGFCCNEYFRDEIVALLCLLFCAMFSQVCVETMVLPLSLKYLDFGELENSLLYFVCGAEVLIVFAVMTFLSRCISDRNLLMFGAVMLLSSNVWLLYFLPKLPTHNRAHNLPIFSVAVVLDVLSIPFLVVCSTSLFSKLTRKPTQGLSQGLRRGIVSVGTIMAPLWGSSASTKPDLLIGVLVALQAFSLVLCVLSFPRLKLSHSKPLDIEQKLDSSPPSSLPVTNQPDIVESTNGAGQIEQNYEESEWADGASSNSDPVDTSQQVHLPSIEGDFYDCHSPLQTPYGSVQRSASFSSFHSIQSNESGSRRLHSSPFV